MVVRSGDTVAGDQASRTKHDNFSEGNLVQVEGHVIEGVSQWRDEVAMSDSEGENGSDSYDDDDDDDDSDLKTDAACTSNAIQLAAQKSTESRPSFGNIVVNSSSDVHFGNKTFYNGPVTIKQFVYTTKNGSVDVHHSETGDNDGDSRVGVDEVLDPVSGELPNGKAKDLTPNTEDVPRIPSEHTLINEPSPEAKGSLLPIWQPTRSEYKVNYICTNWSSRICSLVVKVWHVLIPICALNVLTAKLTTQQWLAMLFLHLVVTMSKNTSNKSFEILARFVLF
jgi:hypothetical protein